MMPLRFPDTLNETRFLKEFWQKQPLLIRGGMAGYKCPLSAEELAGLACEEDIESRIVLEKDGVKPWEARTGPFQEAAFSALPESHWTLLLQDVDKHISEVASLLDSFRFIPDWRLDDIMISYAVDQGSVGPHIDDYDVFLVQAEGKRRWFVDTQPGSEDDHIPGLDLRILPDFKAEHEWLLEPGDVLYLPPNIPHWGVAEGDGCITCSVGFRTPAFQEMVSAWCDTLIQQIPRGRYRDGDLKPQNAKGEIQADSLARVRGLLEQFLHLDTDKQERWFGCFITEPKAHLQVEYQPVPAEPPDFLEAFRSTGKLERNGWSKFAFIRGRNNVDYLFANGEEYPLGKGSDQFLALVTDRRILVYKELSNWLDDADCLQLLTLLYNHGHLNFPDEYE